jgi:hypothetical protein
LLVPEYRSWRSTPLSIREKDHRGKRVAVPIAVVAVYRELVKNSWAKSTKKMQRRRGLSGDLKKAAGERD